MYRNLNHFINKFSPITDVVGKSLIENDTNTIANDKTNLLIYAFALYFHMEWTVDNIIRTTNPALTDIQYFKYLCSILKIKETEVMDYYNLPLQTVNSLGVSLIHG